jgi:hypothetical protein
MSSYRNYYQSSRRKRWLFLSLLLLVGYTIFFIDTIIEDIQRRRLEIRADSANKRHKVEAFKFTPPNSPTVAEPEALIDIPHLENGKDVSITVNQIPFLGIQQLRSIFPLQMTKPQGDRDNERQMLQWVFDRRTIHYQAVCYQIDQLFRTFFLLILLGCIIVHTNPNDFVLPFIGIAVPRFWLHLFIPLSMLTFWLLFGYRSFSAIDSRASLHIIGKEIENLSSFKHIDPYHSIVHALDDIGYIDAWSNFFLVFYVKLESSFIAPMCILFLIYGGLLGCLHASMIVMYITMARRFPSHRKLTFSLLSVTIVMLILSHFTFYIALRYAFSLQVWIWLCCLWCLFLHQLIWRPKIRDCQNEESDGPKPLIVLPP